MGLKTGTLRPSIRESGLRQVLRQKALASVRPLEGNLAGRVEACGLLCIALGGLLFSKQRSLLRREALHLPSRLSLPYAEHFSRHADLAVKHRRHNGDAGDGCHGSQLRGMPLAASQSLLKFVEIRSDGEHDERNRPFG